MRRIATLVSMAAASFPCLAMAAPTLLPMQAYLTDADGAPIDGDVTIDFVLYDDAGSPLFEETQTVGVEAGYLTAYLGDVAALDLATFRDHEDVTVGITVDGEELLPRTTLGSVPFAGFAQFAGDSATCGGLTPEELQAVSWSEIPDVPADLADGDDDTTYSAGAGLQLNGSTFDISDGGVTGAMIADDAITSGDLASDSVTAAEIAIAAVGSDEIADGSVSAAEILDGTVSAADIADGSIGAAEIATDAVGSDEIADGSVTSAEILDGTIASADILDGTITSADIANNAVASADILDGTITSADIANNAVASVDILDNSVTSADIEDGSIASVDIANGTVASTDVQDGAITSVDIANNAVASVDVLDGTLVQADLALSSGADIATACGTYVPVTICIMGDNAGAGINCSAATPLGALCEYDGVGCPGLEAVADFCGTAEWFLRVN